ncbi:uncharacterized protein [Dermacentor albipictus]|uniref:uncharacterized protein n=1 Tax=Dermacentor albipictus TaxID=60249 RepID=UPI0038FC8254
MEPELQTQVNLPVVLMNREGLYAIVAVLGVSILGCACVLTYSLTNYSKMKRNAEEVRNYMASRAKLTHERSGTKQAGGGGSRVAHALPTNDKAAVPAKEPKVEIGKQEGPLSNGNDTFVSQTTTGASAAGTTLEAAGSARGDAQRSGVDQGGGSGDATAAVATAVAKSAPTMVYSIMAANVSWNATGNGSTEAT